MDDLRGGWTTTSESREGECIESYGQLVQPCELHIGQASNGTKGVSGFYPAHSHSGQRLKGTSKNSCFWAAKCDFEVRGASCGFLREFCPGVELDCSGKGVPSAAIGARVVVELRLPPAMRAWPSAPGRPIG